MRIDHLMTKPAKTCRPDQTLGEAAQMMWDGGCGYLPVSASDGSQRLVGVITDRDICLAARSITGALGVLRVWEVMSGNVRACNPGDPITEALEIMREARIECLPVVDESEQVVGLVSVADLACHAVRERDSQNPEITESAIAGLLAAIGEPRENGSTAQRI